MIKPRYRYPVTRTLGRVGLEPYRILGETIQKDLTEAGLPISDLVIETRWDWQTVRRIMVGKRRTDLVELLIIAVLASKSQAEMEERIIEWSRAVLESISPSIPSRWQ